MPSALPSTLPDNLGSNYGLDGYQHEDDYGKGLRDHPGLIPQPPTSGMAKLPQDVVGEMDVEYLDIDMSTPETSFDLPFDLPEDPVLKQAHGLRDGQNVVHHEWFDATQDPARLPQTPDSVEELEALWGGSTTGVTTTGPLPREKAAVLRSLVLSAMRRSAAGQHLAAIEQNLRAQTRDAWERVRPAFEALASEHGLAGNVFVRAAAFPGLHRGKHARALQQLAKRAKYLIEDPAQGHCREAAAALGLQLVASPNDIPWEEEKSRLASKLSALGKRIPPGAPRSSLRQAFLSTPTRAPSLTFFQQGKTPTPVEKVQAPVDLLREAARKQKTRAWTKVAELCKRLLRSGLVTHSQIQEVRRSTDSPESFQKKILAQVRTGAEAKPFSGVVAKAAAPVVREEKQVDFAALKQLRAKQEHQRKLEAFLKRCVSQGILNQKQASELHKQGGSLAEMRTRIRTLQSADPKPSPKYSGSYAFKDARTAHSGGDARVASQVTQYQTKSLEMARRRQMALAQEIHKQQLVEGKLDMIRKAHAVGEDWQAMAAQLSGEEREMVAEALEHLMLTLPAEPRPDGQYTGHVLRAHQAADPVRAPSTALPKAQRWLSQALHRGLQGPSLDREMAQRFGALAREPSLVQIRSRHEGKAGRDYIDAASFASSSGVKGCEEGAKVFRSAKARVVLAMGRCQTCAFRSAQQTCLKYRRPLLQAGEPIPQPEPKAFSRVMADVPEELDLITPSSAMDHLL